MEASSIITQVTREEDQITSFAQDRVVIQTSKKPKRSVFRSLLCCWGRRKHSNDGGGGTAGINGTSSTTGGGANGGSSSGSAGMVVSVTAAEENGRCSPGLPPAPAKYLLQGLRYQDSQKKCMVIDLDETLVHSSFKPISNADFIVPVEIDGTVHQVYVLKRPHVDEFLQRMGELYECVLFTASLAKYADPVADLLDKWGVFRARLFRESCVFYRGNYVKDLGRLGRDLHRVIIVDNSPASYIFHPDNAVPVASWFDDMSDTELKDLIPFFERLSEVDNVYTVLRNSNHPHQLQAIEMNSMPLITANT